MEIINKFVIFIIIITRSEDETFVRCKILSVLISKNEFRLISTCNHQEFEISRINLSEGLKTYRLMLWKSKPTDYMNDTVYLGLELKNSWKLTDLAEGPCKHAHLLFISRFLSNQFYDDWKYECFNLNYICPEIVKGWKKRIKLLKIFNTYFCIEFQLQRNDRHHITIQKNNNKHLRNMLVTTVHRRGICLQIVNLSAGLNRYGSLWFMETSHSLLLAQGPR